MKDNFATRKVKKDDPDFPRQLLYVPSCPKCLYIKGEVNLPQSSVAIVGTRRAGPYGKKVAYDFARELARNNVAVISGLALGIDTQAHRGALDGGGKTWAVLANGLDSIYPATNESLAQKIIQSKGGLISEYSEGTPSYPNQFIARNRIISGLAAAVIIIEAPQESGALATAEFARAQGRPVFAVPGTIHSPTFKGSHKLIKEGAQLVTHPNEILEEIGIKKVSSDSPIITSLGEKEALVFNVLRDVSNPLTVNKLVEITTLMPQDIIKILSRLESEEVVEEIGNGYAIKNFAPPKS